MWNQCAVKMKYFRRLNSELLFRCLAFIVYSYAFFVAVVDVSIFYALLPVLLYSAISYFSLNPPEVHIVTKVLGVNRRAQLRNIDLNASSSHQNQAYPSIAYRAAPLDSSEDVTSAIKSCRRNSCGFVHIDVRITSDSVAVVSHSRNIILGRENFELRENSVEESSFLDLSTRTENSGGTEDIVTLEEIVKLCQILDCRLMINIIHYSYYRSLDSTVDILLQIYEKYSFLFEHCVITSTNPWLLYKIRSHNPMIVVALQWQSLLASSVTTISWLKETSYGLTLERCLLETVDEVILYMFRNFIYLLVGVSAVILPKHRITPATVEYWEGKNIRCIAAIVNLSSEKWYYEHGLGIAYLTETVAQHPLSNF